METSSNQISGPLSGFSSYLNTNNGHVGKFDDQDNNSGQHGSIQTYSKRHINANIASRFPKTVTNTRNNSLLNSKQNTQNDGCDTKRTYRKEEPVEANFDNIVINIPNQIDFVRRDASEGSFHESPEPKGMKQKEMSMDQLSVIDDSSGSDDNKAYSDSCTVKKQETDDDNAVVVVTEQSRVSNNRNSMAKNTEEYDSPLNGKKKLLTVTGLSFGSPKELSDAMQKQREEC